MKALSSDCQAKTQQVKQYTKRAETLRNQTETALSELQETKKKVCGII